MSGTDYITTIGKVAFSLVERKPGFVLILNSAAFAIILYGIFFYLPAKQDEQIKNYDLWQKKHWYDDQAEILETEETLFRAAGNIELSKDLKGELIVAHDRLVKIHGQFIVKKKNVEDALEKSGTRGAPNE